MRLKIAIDCRHIQYYHEGITRSTIALMESLRNDFELHALLSDRRISVPEVEQFPEVTRHYIGPSWSKLDWIWENYSLVNLLKCLKPDMYHAPCTMGLPLQKIPGIRYIVTLHDLLLKFFPLSYPFLGRIKWYIGMYVNIRKADGFITVSHFTKGLLCKQYGVSPEIIHVVPHAISAAFSDSRKELTAIKAERARFGLDSDYIMYHGGFRPYKNVARVIGSYAAYRKLWPKPLKLCIVGSHNLFFKRYVRPYIDQSAYRSDIIATGFISDKELACLLCGAKCFLYLSKMEGFGYAPLEAMACGTPVICSKNSSMVETLGDAVQWVEDHETHEEIAQKIGAISHNARLSEQLSAHGLIQASRFNAGRFKEDMIKAYQDLMKK
jgi:glycosyltransferase involved in cell wall biosynthesis